MIKQHQSLASASSSTSSSSSPIITQLINVLNDETQPPTQLEITILPDRPNATATNTATTTTTTKNNNNDDDGDNDDDSDYYFLKDGIHLGIHAPNLPFLARTFRQEYYSLRRSYYSNNQNYSAASSAVAASSSDAVVTATATATATETKQDVIEKQLWNATTCLLLVCPDHASAWSDRKRILLNNNDTDVAGDGDHDDALSCCGTYNNVNANANNTCAADNRKWQKELEFLNLLFTQHSKA